MRQMSSVLPFFAMACLAGAQDFTADAFATASCFAKDPHALHSSSKSSLCDEELNLDAHPPQSEEAASVNGQVMLQTYKKPSRSEFQHINQDFNQAIAEISAETALEPVAPLTIGSPTKAASPRGRVSSKAFVTMLCLSRSSTFDRPDGLGSEIGTLVHGYMVNRMREAEADNVLLHVVGGSCMKELRMENQLSHTYDRIIEVNGSSGLELVISGSYKIQPHLWLKLLVMNMTEYKRVMWMGFDTFPVRPLTDDSFDCESYPCIEEAGNADLMVFEPNAKEMDRITSHLAENYKALDGFGSYDMGLLHKLYPNMPNKLPLLFHREYEIGPTTDIVHFNMYEKPWFQAYCRFLEPNATLPDAAWLGPKSGGKSSEGKWCLPSLMNNTMYYVFWQVAVEALSGSNLTGDFLLKEDYEHFDTDTACRGELWHCDKDKVCRSFVQSFPTLEPWCH
jgi:hypothetical protein